MASPLRFLHRLPCGTSSPSHRAVYRIIWRESDRRTEIVAATYSAMAIGRRTIFGAASTSTSSSSSAAEAARYRHVQSLTMTEGGDDGRRIAIRRRAHAAASRIVPPSPRRCYHISARANRDVADDADGGVFDRRSNSRGGDDDYDDDDDDDGGGDVVDVGTTSSSSRNVDREIAEATMHHRASFADVPGATNTKSDKMVVVYTCKVCDTRSARQITKHAYDNGVVLIRCPGCDNLHLIADRLGWFEEKGVDGRGWDVERLVEEAGENVRAVSSGDGILELSMEDIVGPTKKG
jgi:hypothetical protein